VISACLAYILLAYPRYEPLPQLTASINAFFLNNIDIHSIPVNNYLLVSFEGVDRIYELSSECSGLILYAMFLIGIFIVPYFSLKHRLIALMFLPVLFLGNSLRIFACVLIGYNYSASASVFFHDTFSQVLIFLWVLVCFIAWLKITKNFPKEHMEVVK
jgi:exosortase/archaeosortase family protein